MSWKKILLEGDALSLGDFMFKQPVRVASTANIDLTTGGLLTIDGIVLVAGDRVLVKNQTTASQNGIYAAAVGTWSRTTDADVSAEVKAELTVMVEEGTVGADTQWQLTTNNPITLGTTNLAFGRVNPALSDTAPANVDHTAAAAGSATDAARRDHKHDLDEGIAATLAPVDGTAEALGTSTAVPHLDHIHALGPLVADLDFAKNNAISMALDVQATAPGTPVDGQIYFNTTDDHPYVYVA